MHKSSHLQKIPWLVWVYPTKIASEFNSAPRLEVTQEMRNLGWKVDLIAFGPDGKLMAEGVEVLCVASPDVYLLRHLFFHMRIIPYILRNWGQIDAILITQVSLLWLSPLRLLYPFSKKHPVFVLDTRTVPMESKEKSTLKDKLRGRFSFLMNGLANILADGQTTITQRMADLLHIPSGKLWGTWASGVNLAIFPSNGSNRRWPQPDEPVQLIYIGMLNYERNLMTFCRTTMEANRLGMNFSFVMYGDGSEKQELQEFADQSNGIIKVFGSIPHDQIPKILALAHVGVLPFPDEEKFRVSSPIKLFEYMGSGLPIFATRITCHTDVIGSGDYVFWAENSNLEGMLKALEKVWQARFALPTLGQKARIVAQDHTYIAVAKRLNNALQYGLSIHRPEAEKMKPHPIS
jgi:glycosyltransferase involved in cell wall biosynthesis